jgi:hypothetical protein
MGSGIAKCCCGFAMFVVCVAWGCTATSNQVVGRYKSAICEAPGSPAVGCTRVIPTASAYAVSIITPPLSLPPSGTTLPPRAIAAYIKALATPRLSPTANDLRTNLGALLAPPSSPAAGIRTVFHRTIIVTVRKEGGFNPADRLEATDVTIQPDLARFDSWDTLATAYTTINAGTIQLTQVREATESLSASSPSSAPVSVSASVAATQSNTRFEVLTASTQAETLSATVEEGGNALVIHRQGGYGIDLTGNTVIQVDMSYSRSPMLTYVFSVAKYVNAKGKWLPGKKVVLDATPVSGVPPGTAITATVTLTYTIRHVTSGDASYEEGKQDVLELTSAPVTRTVTLIPAREASPPGFGLWETTGSTRDFVVNVARPGRGPVGLCFDSYNEASDFLAYMKAANARTPSRVSDAKLGFYVPPNPELQLLTPSELVNLEVRSRCF